MGWKRGIANIRLFLVSAFFLVSLTACDENELPVSEAGHQQSVTLGTEIFLDGTTSYDPDGSISEYQWVILEKPDGSISQIVNPNSPLTMFKTDVGGVYVIELIVFDNENGSDRDYVIVDILAPNSEDTDAPPISEAPLAPNQVALIDKDYIIQLNRLNTPIFMVEPPVSFEIIKAPSSNAQVYLNQNNDWAFNADKVGKYLLRGENSSGHVESLYIVVVDKPYDLSNNYDLQVNVPVSFSLISILTTPLTVINRDYVFVSKPENSTSNFIVSNGNYLFFPDVAGKYIVEVQYTTEDGSNWSDREELLIAADNNSIVPNPNPPLSSSQTFVLGDKYIIDVSKFDTPLFIDNPSAHFELVESPAENALLFANENNEWELTTDVSGGYLIRGEISSGHVVKFYISITEKPWRLSDDRTAPINMPIYFLYASSLTEPPAVLNEVFTIVSKPETSSAELSNLWGSTSLVPDVMGKYVIEIQYVTGDGNIWADREELTVVSDPALLPTFHPFPFSPISNPPIPTFPEVPLLISDIALVNSEHTIDLSYLGITELVNTSSENWGFELAEADTGNARVYLNNNDEWVFMADQPGTYTIKGETSFGNIVEIRVKVVDNFISLGENRLIPLNVPVRLSVFYNRTESMVSSRQFILTSKPESSTAQLNGQVISLTADVEGSYVIEVHQTLKDGTTWTDSVVLSVRTNFIFDPRSHYSIAHWEVEGGCSYCHNGVDNVGKSVTHISSTDECVACHFKIAFKRNVVVDHNEVLGPCKSCHNGTVALDKPALHIESSDDCESCHKTDSWKAAEYNVSPRIASKEEISKIAIPAVENGYGSLKDTVIRTNAELEQFISNIANNRSWNNSVAFLTALDDANVDFSKYNLVIFPYTLGNPGENLTPLEPAWVQDDLFIFISRDGPISPLGMTRSFAFAYKVNKDIGEMHFVVGDDSFVISNR